MRPVPGYSEASLTETICRFDAVHYAKIAESGYSYDPESASDVAFFPAYPLLVRLLTTLSGLAAVPAMLIVSNVCLAIALVLLHSYARISRPGAPPGLAGYAVAACALFPTSVFFRLPYSESLFMLCMMLALFGMASNWNTILVAAIVGLGTAARPVGIALIPPFLLYVWQRRDSDTRPWFHLAIYGLVSAWGLLAYAAYQWVLFGNPLAFATTQQYWVNRAPVSLAEKFVILTSFEPVWGAYVPGNELSLLGFRGGSGSWFGLIIANPAIFAFAALAVAYGAYRRWLNAREILLAAGLLLIPYVTKGYDHSMYSMGRFAVVVIPMYLTMANILVRVPGAVAAVILSVSGLMLVLYTAQYAAGYLIF